MSRVISGSGGGPEPDPRSPIKFRPPTPNLAASPSQNAGCGSIFNAVGEAHGGKRGGTDELFGVVGGPAETGEVLWHPIWAEVTLEPPQRPATGRASQLLRDGRPNTRSLMRDPPDGQTYHRYAKFRVTGTGVRPSGWKWTRSPAATWQELAKCKGGINDRVEAHEDDEQLDPAIGHEGGGEQSHDTDLSTRAAFQDLERPLAMSNSDFTYTAWRKMA